jgi:hypothetical protein
MSAKANSANKAQPIRRKSTKAIANALAAKAGAEGTDASQQGSVEELPAMRPIKTLSPSSFSDFQRCPQLFKFRHIDRYVVPLLLALEEDSTAQNI